MEFRFNVNELLKEPIVKIDNTLIPPNYTGNRRLLYDTVSKNAPQEKILIGVKNKILYQPLKILDDYAHRESAIPLAVSCSSVADNTSQMEISCGQMVAMATSKHPSNFRGGETLSYRDVEFGLVEISYGETVPLVTSVMVTSNSKDEKPVVGKLLVTKMFSSDSSSERFKNKLREIVDDMGVASASAQGLSRPITSAEKLKNSEHNLYIAVDQMANCGKGAVVGILKTGTKSLYLVDKSGGNHKITAPYLHDFYVHETRQRMGWGKYLLENMLFEEKIEPVKMAIDQPTVGLLNFFNKHYGLKDPVKQVNNNFIVYDGFFPEKEAPTTNQMDDADEEDEKHPVGRCKIKPKYNLIFKDEDEEDMYKPKNILK